MTRQPNTNLNSPEIDKLLSLIEEAARASEEAVKHFVEPAQGTLRRASIRRPHIVFGRRGSGKSSLLRKAAADLTVERKPIAYVDMETFKAHSYPDVLISVLIATFREFEKWLRTAAINPANKVSFWDRLFGTVPTTSAYNRKACLALAAKLAAQLEKLGEQLHSDDDVSSESTSRETLSSKSDVGLEGSGKTPGIGLRGKLARENSSELVLERREEYKRNKTDFLHRHILDYQSLFRELSALCGGDSYLFLDDLYHIRKSDQPNVIDYFHRLAKGNDLWLKIGTIKHRSRWYVNGDPPLGLKTSDDADEIDLDLTLEKYSTTKSFLVSVLSSFMKECKGLTVPSILNEGAIDRLVLASGGVARDFLAIFRKAVHVARERGHDHRGAKIGSEDVNVAAGEHEPTKREELKRDTMEDQAEIEKQFKRIVDFCVEEAKANVFLIDKDVTGKDIDLIQELVDLRLVHLVRSRLTVSKYPGKVFQGYMIDLSQYAGSRKRHNFEIVKFWDDKKIEDMRRVKLIYSPRGQDVSAMV